MLTARPSPRVKTAVGAPPPLRGSTPWHLERFAIACRASAIVVARQGHPGHAAHLRRLAAAAQTRAQQNLPRPLERRAA
jgi:hypothetical protein